MKSFYFLFMLASVSVTAAPALQGESSAEWREEKRPDGTAVAVRWSKNTLFLLDASMKEPPEKAWGKATAAVNERATYKIVQETSHRVGEEKGQTALMVEKYAFGSVKPEWVIKEGGERYELLGDYFLFRTMEVGCCGTANSHRFYSTSKGQYLFSNSFTQSGLPIVLRSSAFNPEGFRFIAYLENHWSARDTIKYSLPGKKKFPLAGVLTYASPERVIDKVAIFYDFAAFNDPSQDPEAIVLAGGRKKETYKHSSERPGEFDYWFRDKLTEMPLTAKTVYDGISIEIVFSDEDKVKIPIEKDRLRPEAATFQAKYYTRVAPLPKELWDIQP